MTEELCMDNIVIGQYKRKCPYVLKHLNSLNYRKQGRNPSLCLSESIKSNDSSLWLIFNQQHVGQGQYFQVCVGICELRTCSTW